MTAPVGMTVHAGASSHAPVRTIALLGNPNTGKTTLFNRLSGLRHKTSNFPGTTQEARIGVVRLDAEAVALIDLPGIYSLELEQSEAELCRGVLEGRDAPAGGTHRTPDAVCIVADATNLSRNLILTGDVLRRRLPTVVALNMVDLARHRGLHIDTDTLSESLGSRVIPICARSGEGLDELREALRAPVVPNRTPPGTPEGLELWADEAFASCASAREPRTPRRGVAAFFTHDALTDRLDRLFTHPIGGLVMFVGVMTALFWAIFSLAQIPMSLIEAVFARGSAAVHAMLPDGMLADFLADGVLGGVGSTVIFLPQVCLLFFLISVMEDTGYLARAAFVMNRFLAPFGLSGHAFVPFLSSHACALPGIMSCRAIPDPRERLAAILVAPFMSCTARIPVYVLLTNLLFPDSPWRQSLAFSACYALGIAAGLLSSLLARRTILRGPRRAMALELPSYKRPSLRTAALSAWDRGWTFLRKAGTNILAICVILWWLSAFPRSSPPPHAVELRASVESLADEDLAPVSAAAAPGEVTPLTAGQVRARADHLEARHSLAHSYAGRIGRAVQPVFEPLGFDWKLSVGVITSFAAREVFVSTMAVMTAGSDDTDDPGVMRALAAERRDDGVTPIFTPGASWALLVYYVLAMQCLPTLAVTAKETGKMRWALLQLAWMSLLAYGSGMLAFWIAG